MEPCSVLSNEKGFRSCPTVKKIVGWGVSIDSVNCEHCRRAGLPTENNPHICSFIIADCLKGRVGGQDSEAFPVDRTRAIVLRELIGSGVINKKEAQDILFGGYARGHLTREEVLELARGEGINV